MIFPVRTNSPHCLNAILDETSLERLRISSVEPMDWTDEVIDIVSSSDRIAKHAHVPMQSGSDRVLRLMHRKYRPWHYAEKIRKIRAAMPTAAIGADVMVGFPGETDAISRRLERLSPSCHLLIYTFSLIRRVQERPRPPCPIRSPSQLPASATESCAS